MAVKRKMFEHPVSEESEYETQVGLFKKRIEKKIYYKQSEWHEVLQKALEFIGSIDPNNLISVNEYSSPPYNNGAFWMTTITVYYRED